MWLLGVILAGLFLVLRPVPGILKANASGVIVRKGHGSVRVERIAEPERFRTLMRQRLAEMIPGAILLAAGLAWLILNLVAAAAQAPR